jgi:Domain of unknown function (DUF929)
VTRDQPALRVGSKLRVVYLGAEYCPYCAILRWSLVSALSRFGTFQNLRDTYSAADDGDIPTFSFYESHFSSTYLDFTPYETMDRNEDPLQSTPADVSALYSTYDGNSTTGVATAPFNPGGVGIPFLDIGNGYLSAGIPNFFDPAFTALSGDKYGMRDIARALNDPTTPAATTIGANLLLAEANYITAAICASDGHLPADVCSSSGVGVAATKLAVAPRVS